MHLSGPARRARGAGYVVELLGRVSSLLHRSPPRQTDGRIVIESQPAWSPAAAALIPSAAGGQFARSLNS